MSIRQRVVFGLSSLAFVACGAAAVPAVRRSLSSIGGASTVAPAASSAPIEESPPPPPPEPRSPFAYANIDPSDDFVVGPPDVRPTCEDDLAAAGVSFKPATLAVHTPKKSKITCGAPQVVMYRGSPAKIAYQPSVMLTCTMALSLARFETILQDEAKRIYGKRVVKIHHIGTYACREMAAYPGWVSEHSYANAIDLSDFVLEDGRTIDIYKQFGPKQAAPKGDAGTFLRAIARRAYQEEVFSSVLTPFFDKLHSNHFHLDLARFRSDGTTFMGEEPAP